jgi:hypothetical protein
MNPNGPWPQKWTSTNVPKVTFDVYPTAYMGTLNYGLNQHHAVMKVFPTAESVMARARGEDPRDQLTLLDQPGPSGGFGKIPRSATGGLQLSGLHVIRLNAGDTLYRFGDTGKHNGGWWIDRRALMRILLRVEPAKDGLPGVRNGTELNIRDYARKYCEVLTEWKSNMKYLYATRLQGAVMAFGGMGAAQRSKDVITIANPDGSAHAVTYEHLADDNRQIFIPNVYTRVDNALPREPRFFGPIAKWHPEVLEQCLVPLVRERFARNETYRQIITDVEAWMVGGNRKALFGGLTPPALGELRA